MTPPRPRSASAVRSHGVWSRRDPRNPTIRRPAIFCRSDGPAEGVRRGDGLGTVEAGDDDSGEGDGGAALADADAAAAPDGDGTAGEPQAARNSATPPRTPARSRSRRVIWATDETGGTDD